MSELVVRLGERIRNMRKEKGLSQEQLGELAGLHTNYIGQVERGEKNLTIETLEKIAHGLGVSLEKLFHFLDPMKTKDETSELLELLDKRSKEDKALVLTLAKSVFKWEQQKRH
jgi:XRE family transcriptional regulator, regulator of sulfur utilization